MSFDDVDNIDHNNMAGGDLLVDGDVVTAPTMSSPNTNRTDWKSRAVFHLQHHWKIIVLGQLLSLLLASGGAAQATLHLDCDLSAPTFTMALIYFVLSFNLVWIWLRQRRRMTGSMLETEEKDGITRERVHQQENNNHNDEDVGEQESNPWDPLPATNFTLFGVIKLHRPAWHYFFIAFLDIEANVITMLAFKYTTLTSVSLFDALAIPSSMILSRCFFGRQYTWVHIFGVATSMTGVVINVLQDYESGQTEDKVYPHKTRGDILAITAGVLWGLSNTLIEVMVRHNGNTTEYLGVMGFFGFCIALVQSLVFEFGDILEFFGRDPDQSSTCSLTMGWWLYFVFVGVTLASYMGASQFLIISEAAYFSLSLLTGDLWSVVFSIVAEHIVPQPLFFLALIFVLSGVVLYEMAPSPVKSDNEQPPVPLPGDDEHHHQDDAQYEVSILPTDSNES
jgi:solute carrier family 35 protein F1/2